MRRTLPPIWFQVLVAAALALCVRELDAWLVRPGAGGDEAPPFQMAFWQIIGLVVGWIWTGVQVAAKITLQILAWSVKVLWAFATATANALKAVGKLLVKAGLKTWDFMRATYEHVLKPAWDKFWKLVDRVQRTLEKIFRPILRFLDRVRAAVDRIYKRFIRPVLDAIGIARKVLRVFATLGADWAKALDRKLADLEERIDAPFRLLRAKLNEVINLVNRVVTLDGLFQRLALIRSVQRDVRYVMNVWWNAAHRNVSDAERAAAIEKPKTKTLATHVGEVRAVTRAHSGPLQSRVSEEVADVKLLLRRARTGASGVV